MSRDRALQLERKKKAAAFLKLKSAENNSVEVKSDVVAVDVLSAVAQVAPSIDRAINDEKKSEQNSTDIEQNGGEEEENRKNKSSKRKKTHKR